MAEAACPARCLLVAHERAGLLLEELDELGKGDGPQHARQLGDIVRHEQPPREPEGVHADVELRPREVEEPDEILRRPLAQEEVEVDEVARLKALRTACTLFTLMSRTDSTRTPFHVERRSIGSYG